MIDCQSAREPTSPFPASFGACTCPATQVYQKRRHMYTYVYISNRMRPPPPRRPGRSGRLTRESRLNFATESWKEQYRRVVFTVTKGYYVLPVRALENWFPLRETKMTHTHRHLPIHTHQKAKQGFVRALSPARSQWWLDRPRQDYERSIPSVYYSRVTVKSSLPRHVTKIR
jgi:hypothetical protein